MSKHVTYRGVTLDMDSIRRENEKVPAIGNMKVNARGDQIRGGQIIKNVSEVAKENHKLQSAVVNTGLKGPLPEAAKDLTLAPKATPAKKDKSVREVELPSGDIIIEEDK